MYCNQCGESVDAMAKFCHSCGNNLKSVKNTGKESEKDLNNSVDEATCHTTDNENQYTPAGFEVIQTRKKTKANKFFLGMAVLVMITGAIGFE